MLKKFILSFLINILIIVFSGSEESSHHTLCTDYFHVIEEIESLFKLRIDLLLLTHSHDYYERVCIVNCVVDLNETNDSIMIFSKLHLPYLIFENVSFPSNLPTIAFHEATIDKLHFNMCKFNDSFINFKVTHIIIIMQI